MLKTFSLSLIVLLAGIFLTGCLPKHKLTNNPNQTTTTVTKQKKVGNTTLTGKITKAGDKYFITVSGKQPQDLDSYSVDLSQYVGKTVTVTGQYSGDTLFVGKIK